MMESGNSKEVCDHIVRTGWESYGDSWSQMNQALAHDVISGGEADEVWLMTELTKQTVDLSLEILKAKLFFSEYDWLIVEMRTSQDRWLALVLSWNRFYGLECV